MAPIKAGDKVPAIELDIDFPPTKVNVAEYTKDKKVIILGLPGYLAKQDALKAKGINEVMVYCVNDGAVMKAWAADQKIEGSILKFYGDPTSAFTRACDMELVHPGPVGVGLLGRCKRFALFVVNGEVRYMALAEDPEFDPAGDDYPEKTLVEAMLKAIEETV